MRRLILFSFLLVSGVAHAFVMQPLHTTPMFIGHRGSGADNKKIPENSISSVRQAFADGADAVEFDVQLSSDGKVVIAHDVKLERISEGEGCVAETTYAKMRKLRLRDGSGQVHSETVETLDQMLDVIAPFENTCSREFEFIADIHIKVYDGLHGDWGGINNPCSATNYAKLTAEVLRIVDKHGLLDRVLFTSFDERVLDIIRKKIPYAKVGLLSFFAGHSAVEKSAKRYDAVVLHDGHYDDNDTKLAQDEKLSAFVWTPVTVKEMENIFASQYLVDGVITDNIPNALKAWENHWYIAPRTGELNGESNLSAR